MFARWPLFLSILVVCLEAHSVGPTCFDLLATASNVISLQRWREEGPMVATYRAREIEEARLRYLEILEDGDLGGLLRIQEGRLFAPAEPSTIFSVLRTLRTTRAATRFRRSLRRLLDRIDNLEEIAAMTTATPSALRASFDRKLLAVDAGIARLYRLYPEQIEIIAQAIQLEQKLDQKLSPRYFVYVNVYGMPKEYQDLAENHFPFVQPREIREAYDYLWPILGFEDFFKAWKAGRKEIIDLLRQI